MSLMSYATAYITNTSPSDVPMMSFSILAGGLCACTLTYEWNTLTQSVSPWAFTLKVSLLSQTLQPQVHTVTLSPRYIGTSLCQAWQANNLLSEYK